MGFPETLRYLREQNKLTQTEFGRYFNLSKQTISAYENGAASPPLDMLILFADFFKVSLDYLAGRHEDELAEEGVMYGLSSEAKQRVADYANYERYRSDNSPSEPKLSSLLNKNEGDDNPNLKKARPNKYDPSMQPIIPGIDLHSTEVLAAHRVDNPMDDLPEEALKSIEDFKAYHLAYVENMRLQEKANKKKRK